MPLASLFTTKPVQKTLIKDIQKPIVDTFSVLYSAPRNTRFILLVLIEVIKTLWHIYRLPRPTKANTNKHNTHILIELRDWFLEHEHPNSMRRAMYDGLLSFVAQKYDWDGYNGSRLDAWLRQWKKSDWIDTGKQPESMWILNDEDKQAPTYLRQEALKKALREGDWARAINLVE